MGAIDNIDAGGVRNLVARIERLERSAPTGFSSITRGQLRVGGSAQLLVDSSGGVVVNGSFGGSGGFSWTGPTTLTGTSNFNGPTNVGGTCTVTGTMNVNGPFNLSGAATLSSTLTCSGSIVVNGSPNMTLGTTFAGAGLTFGTGAILSSVSGGGAGLFASTTSSSIQITSTLASMAVGSKNVTVGASAITVNGPLTVNGSQTVTGTKSFLMDHPTKPGMWLQHASTESPVSGVEYWGSDEFDLAGECVIVLANYFESLAKEQGRTVMVSAVGRPFLVGADSISDGRFTAYGEPGRHFNWLVKAERFTADFPVEWEKPAAA